MKMQKIDYYMVNDTTYRCLIKFDGKDFFGDAICHEDDYDFQSEKTGYNIAQLRAEIKLYKYLRDNALIKYNIYKDMYNNLSRVNCAAEGTEMQYIKKQMDRRYEDLVGAREAVKTTRKYLNYYIVNKDKLYKKLRAKNN